jgi:hypothetical protein
MQSLSQPTMFQTEGLAFETEAKERCILAGAHNAFANYVDTHYLKAPALSAVIPSPSDLNNFSV